MWEFEGTNGTRNTRRKHDKDIKVAQQGLCALFHPHSRGQFSQMVLSFLSGFLRMACLYSQVKLDPGLQVSTRKGSLCELGEGREGGLGATQLSTALQNRERGNEEVRLSGPTSFEGIDPQ